MGVVRVVGWRGGCVLVEEGCVVLVREGELVEARVDLVLAAGSRTLPLDLMSRSALAAIGREGRRSVARQLNCLCIKCLPN